MTSFFKKLATIIASDDDRGDQSVSKDAPPQRKEEIFGMRSLKNNENEDFRLLFALYKRNKSDENIDIAAMVKKLNPAATPHTCPYCSAVHEFTASRARKCLSCSEKMIVRQGLFVTESHAKQLEKTIQDFYEKQNLFMRVRSALEAAQNYRVNGEPVEHLRNLAEAFRYMAQVANQRDANGFSFWDKAWGYYNQAREEEMRTLRRDMMQYSCLPDICWDMTQMLFDKTKSMTGEEQRRRGERSALSHAFMTLAETAILNADPYFVTELYGFSKKIIVEWVISDEEFHKITADAATRPGMTSDALKRYTKRIEELLEYEIL